MDVIKSMKHHDMTLAVLFVLYLVFNIQAPTQVCGMFDNMIGNINHILAADCGLGLSHQLGIVNEEEGVPYRATFIFDKNRIVQHVSINALDTGRNAQEVLRTLKALQAGGLTGCAWNEGEEFVG